MGEQLIVEVGGGFTSLIQAIGAEKQHYESHVLSSFGGIEHFSAGIISCCIATSEGRSHSHSF